MREEARRNEGTTSACAENTFVIQVTNINEWNYLRVRGEYSMPPLARASIAELPPRARRIPQLIGRWRGGKGTTSACAENTRWWWDQESTHRNYLRVRGEYEPLR